jgi:hypothetical protein
MSGHWPPDAGDDEGAAEAADQHNTEAAERLSAVSAFLSGVPAPVLPPAVEARISAALAAEAAARTAAADDAAAAPSGPSAADPAPAGSEPAPAPEAGAGRARTPGPAPGRARVRRRPRRRRTFRVGGSLAVVCLVLAGFGFLLSRASGPTYSGSASSGSAAGSAASSAAAPEAGSEGGNQRISGAGPEKTQPSASASAATPFTVTESGTAYRKAELAGQVRAVLASRTPGAAEPAPASSAASGAAGAASGHAVPAGLAGCVLHLTDAPKLVDRATYQGNPAYVIASASRVWVVGLGCTAAAPDVTASVPLARLPGNLRALVSVKREA